MKGKKIIYSIIIVVLLGVIGFLGYGYVNGIFGKKPNPVVTMEIADYGTMKIELYPEYAPNTVANFVKLINEGYYDGLEFHRTIPGFMIQGGEKTGDGAVDYCIPGEFLANGFKQNTLRHSEGVISMARADYSSVSSSLTEEGYNSASTQFFIMDGDSKSLDSYYTAFGKVIEGQDIVNKIANTAVVYRSESLGENEETPKDADGNEIASDRPVTPPVITKMTVDTFGVKYKDPTTVAPFDYYSWLMSQYSNMGVDTNQDTTSSDENAETEIDTVEE